MSHMIIIRGGGDLASGIALRLFHAGLQVIITELPEPLAVRRAVAFAEAVYDGRTKVEGVEGILVTDWLHSDAVLQQGCIPVLVDPQLSILKSNLSDRFSRGSIIIVDARMTKKPPEDKWNHVALNIGIGPGFLAGTNCDVVIETNRGHQMGRVIWQGSAETDTGVPERVISQGKERVLRAGCDGVISGLVEIGEHISEGQILADISGMPVVAPFRGVLRGMLHSGLRVWSGLKIGDVDPRDDPKFCFLVSDKSLAIAGGILEAILSRPELRSEILN